MILQVRGTSGSGKSYVVREFMRGFKWKPLVLKGKRKPLLYFLQEDVRVQVFGHYETECGGGDLIGSTPEIVAVLEEYNPSVGIVEGLLLSEDVIHTVEMDNPICLFLTTPLERCLEQVQRRQEGRVIKNPDRVVEKLHKRYHAIERVRKRLIEADVYCKKITVEQAISFLKRKLSEYLHDDGVRIR